MTGKQAGKAGVRPQFSALNAVDLALASQKMENEARDFIIALLPLLDGIDRVRHGMLAHAERHDAPFETIELLADLADATIAKVELERTGRVGEMVDRLRHEIVATLADSDRPKGTIVEVVESGWIFRGVTVRHARVVVSLGSAAVE